MQPQSLFHPLNFAISMRSSAAHIAPEITEPPPRPKILVFPASFLARVLPDADATADGRFGGADLGVVRPFAGAVE